MSAQGDTGPLYVESVPWLDKYLAALEWLTASKEPPEGRPRARAWEFAYLMGDASGEVFGYTLWI